MEFFLVRSPNTYGKKCSDTFPHGKVDTLKEAQGIAIELATRTRETQYVYKVVLVGKAAVQEAVFTPLDESKDSFNYNVP